MATKTNDKKPEKVVVADKDHPSLIEVGGKIRLRVLEDFYIEQELPKWKRFKDEWEKFKKAIGFSFSGSMTPEEAESCIKRLDKPEEEKEILRKQARNLIAMDKAVQDDRWHIREKHEREVDESVLKQAKFVSQRTVWDKVRNAFGLRNRKTVPVEVAMVDLFDHIELTSTEDLAARMAKLNEVEAGMRQAGQYKKAEVVKQLKAIVAEESVVIAAGFTSYVSEDTMIDFLRKSERGTMVDFLRYYEDEIPQEAVEKKLAADKLMVFDNYVVAHYSDIIQKATAVEKKVSAKEEKKQREKRRDPILFGVIKNSRKLYFICDWTTDTDDLTLEKLEKELGVTRGSLVKGAETSAQAASQYTFRDAEESDGTNNSARRRMAVDAYERMTDAMEDIAVLRGQLDRAIGTRSYQWSNGSLATTDSARPF